MKIQLEPRRVREFFATITCTLAAANILYLFLITWGPKSIVIEAIFTVIYMDYERL
jgi:hypothetical protein